MGSCSCSPRFEADSLDPTIFLHLEQTPLTLVAFDKIDEVLRDPVPSIPTISNSASAENECKNSTFMVDREDVIGKNEAGREDSQASEQLCVEDTCQELTLVVHVAEDEADAEAKTEKEDQNPKRKQTVKDSVTHVGGLTKRKKMCGSKKSLPTGEFKNQRQEISDKSGSVSNSTKKQVVKGSQNVKTKMASCLETSEPEKCRESNACGETEAKALAQAEAGDEKWQMEMGLVTHRKRTSFLGSSFLKMVSKDADLKEINVSKRLEAGAIHFLKGTRMFPPWPGNMQKAMFGMGCFWCAENCFMKLKGVFSTQVGFAGGKLINPTYESVSLDASFAKTGETGKQDHVEVVRVIFDPKEISYNDLLKIFWERHDPTQGNRQGRDEGYQYRSFIGCCAGEQKHLATLSRESFAFALKQKGISRPITTEIRNPAPHFWYAEEVHQQYDAKPTSRPYCGLSPTGARLAL